MKNINIKKFIITLFIFIFLPFASSAFDLGLILNLNTGYEGAGTGENQFDFSVNLWPRFSALIGKNGEFLLTAGVTAGLADEFYFVPELLHTEFTLRFGNSGLRIGRFDYSDPLSLIVSGLFDGVQYFHNTNAGIFRAGAWYTGFLYKKNANISMTPHDQAGLAVQFDYKNFFSTYFASRRVFMSFEWEHPSINEILRLNAALIGQFDLTDSQSKYHSQYLIIKAGMPVRDFFIELGGCLELSQTDEGTCLAFAGEFGFSWLFSSEFNSMLSLKGTIAGGRINDTLTAFNPITVKYYGYILKHKMTGLSVITINYSTRIQQTMSAFVNASYFVRNDLGTFQGYPAAGTDEGFFLGPEISASFIWSPFSDLQMNLGAGLFIPQLGNAGADEKIRWRIDLSVIMALY